MDYKTIVLNDLIRNLEIKIEAFDKLSDWNDLLITGLKKIHDFEQNKTLKETTKIFYKELEDILTYFNLKEVMYN